MIEDRTQDTSGKATTAKPPVRVKIGHAKIGHAATMPEWIRANLGGIGASCRIPVQGVTGDDLRRMRTPVAYCRGTDFDGAAAFS